MTCAELLMYTNQKTSAGISDRNRIGYGHGKGRVAQYRADSLSYSLFTTYIRSRVAESKILTDKVATRVT